MASVQSDTATPTTYVEGTLDPVSSIELFSERRKFSEQLVRFCQFVKQGVAHRELVSRRDGDVSSSSGIEIVIRKPRDEDYLGLSLIPYNLMVEEGLVPQPDMDDLLGIPPTKSTDKLLAKMILSCGMPSELEFRFCNGHERSWTPLEDYICYMSPFLLSVTFGSHCQSFSSYIVLGAV